MVTPRDQADVISASASLPLKMASKSKSLYLMFLQSLAQIFGSIIMFTISLLISFFFL